jgi:cyclopropane-fatty-acyl-phospholipid synthase
MSLACACSDQARLLNHLFHGYAGPPFSIRFPFWTWHSAGSQQPVFSLVLRSSDTFDKLMRPSETGLGEAFISGDPDVEGDIFSAFAMAEWLLHRRTGLRYRILGELYDGCRAARTWLAGGPKHSRQRDAASIAQHYDLPVEFYEPWLGPTLLYSSAYFRNRAESLDQAQIHKLDLICRKLDLHPGDHFMDIGCGWGSLAIHAASRYRAQTQAITISRSQERVAARRVSKACLGERCIVEYRDYRDTRNLRCAFDKLASIGMFEHVGVSNLQNYFRAALELLRPGGLFLNSGIVRAHDSPRRKQSFIDRYVFPDGELPTLAQAVQAAEEAGFEVRDVESLREHYAVTLRRWVGNLQQSSTELLKTVSERTFRTWLLYMAGSAAAFERGDISVYQLLLRRPDREHNAQLFTRASWYANNPSESSDLAA